MADVIVDIETDDLDATVIHVACTRVVGTEDRRTFTSENMSELPDYLRQFDWMYGHNAVNFDIPVINRLLCGPGGAADLDLSKVRDTMLISQLLWPDRPGGHSLRAWGLRLEDAKIDFHDWSLGATAEMIEYCRQDVDLTHRLLKYLQAEAYQMDKAAGGASWRSSIVMEHRVRAVMNSVEDHGYYLDQPRAASLVARLSTEVAEIEAEVLSEMPDLPKPRRLVAPKYKKDGTMSSVGLKHLNDPSVCGGQHTAIEWQTFNLASRQQIAERLQRQGWVPRKHTEKGQPIVDEATLSAIDLPLAQKIARYLMLQKRVAQVTSWLDKADPDSRVRPGYLTLGAITHRMSCTGPNLQQVPGPRSEYGEECRSCWTVPSGRQLIGTDLAGIELRCLAHYLNDKDYTEELIHGDVHTRTQEIVGLPSRADAKTFTYAYLYSAGDARLGAIIGEGRDAGARMRDRYVRGFPTLSKLQQSVAREAATGRVRGLDGRLLRIRSEHAALNTLLQSCGAIVAKQWLLNVHEMLPEGAAIVAMVHDELCIEADKNTDPEQIGAIAKKAVTMAEEQLGFRCPLDCDWHVGQNWSEVH